MITLPGADLASFQGPPGEWQPHAAGLAWVGVKFTELTAGQPLYTDPDALADWAAAKAAGLGRVAYLFGHPAAAPAATVDGFLSVLSPVLTGSDAVAVDLEVNDGLPPGRVALWAAQVMTLLEQRLGRRPVLYTFLDFAESGNCAGLGSYPLWISDPDSPAGRPAVPGPWSTWAIHQYATSGAMDRDVAAYPSLEAMRAELGKPAPQPVTEDPGMIMIQPDESQVPKGGTWPGVFMLYSNGTLRHITGNAGGVSNVAAYTAAGVKGPVTVTWAEWETLQAAPAQ